MKKMYLVAKGLALDPDQYKAGQSINFVVHHKREEAIKAAEASVQGSPNTSAIIAETTLHAAPTAPPIKLTEITDDIPAKKKK